MNQNRNKQCFDGCRSEAVACSGMVCYNYNAKLQLVVWCETEDIPPCRSVIILILKE